MTKKEMAIAEIMKNPNDDGKYGRAMEIFCKASNEVSGKGETDKKMFVTDENGKKHLVNVEIKTNGGRIDNIEKSDYVIYAMDICNSTTKGKRRVCEPCIMKASTFMDILKKCGAIKRVNRNGLYDGKAIQVSNKAFYETMRDYPVKYINGKAYLVREIQ